MSRDNLNELAVLAAVARTRSFSRAAIELGVSQSAVSHSMRHLEERLGLRLLARTTRSVAPTEQGERLLRAIEPHLTAIQTELAALRGRGERPAGVIRLTAVEHASITLLYPAIAWWAEAHPEVKIELSIDNSLVDIVANRFDAGVRFRDEIERDMIAVPIGPDVRMAIVATPSYFDARAMPRVPRDLGAHNCINVRLPTYGGLVPWEFEKGGHKMTVRVEGQLTFNARITALGAVLDGLGLGCCPEDLVMDHIANGRLVRVMEDWCPTFAGYHLYYPSRRQLSPVFLRFIDALRYRGNGDDGGNDGDAARQLPAWPQIPVDGPPRKRIRMTTPGRV